MKNPHTLRPSVLGGVASLILIACSSGTEPRDDFSPSDGFPETGQIELQLTRAADCSDLLGTIQDNVIAQLGERAKELRTATYGYGSGPAFGGGMGTATPGTNVSDPSPVPDSPPTQTPGDGEAPSGAPNMSNDDAVDNGGVPPSPQNPTEEGGGFSGTTVQVKDVDEADIVKTDGDLLYLLHGSTLFVLSAWPAQSTEILASTRIEGQPVEMFVRDGKAVVFSRLYRDLARESGIVPASSSYYAPTQYTKLTVLDVSGDAPSVSRESYIEGDYLSARRHDGIVRAVVQDGFKVPPLGNPSIEYTDPFGQRYPQADIDLQVDAWLERMTRSIRATDLGVWLPREFERSGDTFTLQQPRCADYYAPDAGLTQSGVTSIVSLDLDDVPAPLGGATILGQAERVYSNEDVVLVTQSDYRFWWSPGAREQTIIHRFDIAGASTAYTASGAVAGSIHDQFSLDERDGIIAVSTTERQNGNVGMAVDLPAPVPPAADEDVAIMPAPGPIAPRPNGPVNRIVTLGTDGTELVELGATEDFGQNEQIFATRFLGDRAYVVTFRQTDPLFVVDMSDATDPRVVGELHIPGFSNFLFPLGSDHLFAIGRDATATGAVQGLALQVFDVSDPAAPALATKFVFADLGDSPANIDHRAINFHANGNIVAFPHQSWQTGESTLEVFQISPEVITRLGGMGMPDVVDLDECLGKLGYDPAYAAELRAQLANDPAWQREIIASCSYDRRFVRGLFRDEVVYGISTSGVYAYDIDALDAGALGQASLPAPIYDNGYGYGMTDPGVALPPEMSAPPGGAAGTPAPGMEMMPDSSDMTPPEGEPEKEEAE